jgi:hypothetical protein
MKQPSPELESKIKNFVEALRGQVLPDNTVLERVTPRWSIGDVGSGARE